MGSSTGLPYTRPHRTVGLIVMIVGIVVVLFSLLLGIVIVVIGLILYLIRRPAPAPVATYQPRR